MVHIETVNERQRKFVEAYMKTGNALESARLAGYKSPHPTGARLLQKATIKKAIEERVESDPAVWGRKELIRFWTEMAQSADGDNNRLKASELLAKAEAMFVQKMEVQHNFQNKSDDEVLEDVIADLRARGYKVEPPK